MRLVVKAEDYEDATRFYRDVLGAPSNSSSTATTVRALLEALIEDIEIQADDSVIPLFRIPTTDNGERLP